MAITVNGGAPIDVTLAVEGKNGAGRFQAFQYNVDIDGTANPVQPLIDAIGATGMQAAVVSLFDSGGIALTSGGAAVLPVLDAGTQTIVFRLPSDGTVIANSAGPLNGVVLTAWIRM